MKKASVAIFALAIAVRIAILATHLVPREWILTGAHAEVDAVARSVALSGRFADPYLVPTGPTAHPLPIHTALQALVYLALGFTPAAAWARSILGIISFAAAAALLPWFACRVGLGMRVGVAAGVLMAAVPFSGIDDVLGWLWNESMAAMALLLIVGAFTRRWKSREPPSTRSSLALGLGIGMAFHVAPPLLPVVVLLLCFEASWVRGAKRWLGAAAVVAGAFAASLPWGWRVYDQLGEVFFVRSNFGLELRLGNHEGAIADLWSAGPTELHPGKNLYEAEQVRALGEARYMARARAGALEWIGANPAEFARLTVSRIWHIWFGPPARPDAAIRISVLTLLAAAGFLRVRRRLTSPELAAIAIPLVAYPLVYYVVGYAPRYVVPIQGVVLVLAVSAVMRHDPSAAACPTR